jgi:ribosomal protein S18 acetylase RimI-like enzyme
MQHGARGRRTWAILCHARSPAQRACATTTRMHDLSPEAVMDLAACNMTEFAKTAALWDARGEVQIADDVQFVASGTRFPAGFFNCVQALGAGPDRQRSQAWLDRAVDYYAERERGFCVCTRGERDRSLADACEARKMRGFDGGPGMVLDAPVEPLSQPADLRIDLVTDVKGVADFVAVAAPAYEMLSLPAAVTREVFADAERILSSAVALYVAYLADQPAATGLSLASHGIAGLYWIATRGDLQRRGLADALTRRASNDAFERGAARVILQASPDGEPVYRRIGFRSVTRYARFFVTRAACLEAAARAAGRTRRAP